MSRFSSPLLAILLILAARSVRAENLITMGYAEAEAGDRDIQVIVTATNDVPIHGFSIALTFAVPELRLGSISLAGTHVGVLEPLYVSRAIDNRLGIATLGVILDLPVGGEIPPATPREIEPTADGSSPMIIARLTFDVRSTAAGGVYPLELRDGIGTPASYNRFSNAGSSIEPRLEDGQFVVTGGNVLALDKRLAIPGGTSNLVMYARAAHEDPIGGFQIGYTFEKQHLELRDASFTATDVILRLGATGIETFHFDLDLNFSSTLARSTAAVLFDSAPPFNANQVLPPSTSFPPTQTLVRYTFRVLASTREYHDLVVASTGIPGAIDNRFFIDAESVDPRLLSGKVFFCRGDLAGQVVDSETGAGVSGVAVTTDPPCNNDHGDIITATTNNSGNFTLQDLPPGNFTVIFRKFGFYDQRLSGATVVCAGSNVGRIPIYEIPVTPSEPFRRGFINRDTRLDLSDAVTILNHLFLGTGGVPCIEAADVNDDAQVNIADPVFELNFLFVGGPRPPPPYDECGSDPTPPPANRAPLGCTESPSC